MLHASTDEAAAETALGDHAQSFLEQPSLPLGAGELVAALVRSGSAPRGERRIEAGAHGLLILRHRRIEDCWSTD